MYQVQCARLHWMQIPADALGERLLCPTCNTYVTLPAAPDGLPREPRYDFQCPQGHLLRVKAKYLGRQVNCPECQVPVQIRGIHALGPPPHVMVGHPVAELMPPPPPAPVTPGHVPVTHVAPTVVDDIPVAHVDHEASKKSAVRVRDVVEQDEEEIDPQLAKLDRHAMRRAFGVVDLGLAIIKWSIIVGVVALVMLCFVLILGGFLHIVGVRELTTFSVLRRFAEVLRYVGYGCLVTYAIGQILQLLVPPRTGALVWAICALLALIASPALIYWLKYKQNPIAYQPGVIIYISGDNTRTEMFMHWLFAVLLISVPWALFVMYLRQITIFLRKPLMRSDTNFLLFLGFGLGGLCIVIQLIAVLLFEVNPYFSATMQIFYLLTLAGCLSLLAIKHVFHIDSLRYAMSRYEP